MFRLGWCWTAAVTMFALTACGSPPEYNSGQSRPRFSITTPPSSPGVPGNPQRDFAIVAGDLIYFDYNSSALKPESRDTLERQARWLKRHTQWHLVIEGHCDERGTRDYNLALGEHRAHAVKANLINLGIPPTRISIVSYGKERPAVLGTGEAAWAQNRRAMTVLAK